MADQGAPASPPPNRRRASIVDMFNPRSHSTTAAMSSSPPSAAVPANPAPHHRRGASITSLGLTTNPSNQSSPYSAFARQRRASIATSSASGSPEFRNSFGDEPAVIEEDDQTQATIQPPASPSFARRVSFGAQALRDVKGGGGSPSASGGGRRPSSSLFTLDENSENATPSRKVASGTAKTAGEGFNWSEAIRDRTRRSPSFSSGNPFSSHSTRPRSASISNPAPPKEITKPAESMSKMKKPDHLGERMLRGDFMMD
ncbi:uncharacterized protein A1O9_11384 [Exophiala aquamarina CBS 119918]|uniref:Uncharacterized protein n=1 Tax=Exophiala aquamarina CBS 119918 TaxID=1182545 RepID=A0A072NYP9_9EURO|nr:uncharacterized protein A1O9_11384 [Exophiala aquamarina CBS 119918]KEF52542.1 hypothetical protein A1O9_11384 [Exophiala aquamarina CBS 119918]